MVKWYYILCLPGASDGRESAFSAQTQIQSLGQKDPLEKGMPTHSSILAWRIPLTTYIIFCITWWCYKLYSIENLLF